MEKTVLLGLEQNRKRLQYFSHIKEKSGLKVSPSVDKWIEIYSERMVDFEERAKKLGLSLSPEVDSSFHRN